jgi:hypothetical protein
MQSFRDSSGREWCLAINALNLRQASQRFGFKIVKATDNPPDKDTLDRLADADTFPDVVHWFLVDRPPLDEFLSVLDGPTIYEAGKAFYLELANFSQPHAKGLNEAKAKKAQELVEVATKLAATKTEGLAIGALLQTMRLSGNLSTESPDTLEPISER